MERPRGPDVQMTVDVPDAWIARGATVTIELPRNLTCAACEGGGCDACERSGAVSLRGRKDPVEIVEVTLPQASMDDTTPSTTRVVVLRIPDRGGLPTQTDIELPRGNLLLSVKGGADEASRGVKRLARPSMPAPAPVEVVSVKPAPRVPSLRPATRPPLWLLAAIAVAVGAALYWFLRR